jgi:hypothetical protein
VVRPATYDKSTSEWTVEVDRAGERHSLQARHLVLATGPGGSIPTIPPYPHQQGFTGIWLHSIDYKDVSAWKGKRVVVVGTANTGMRDRFWSVLPASGLRLADQGDVPSTAHDIAKDCVEAGIEVTMVQRSTTCLFLPRFPLDHSPPHTALTLSPPRAIVDVVPRTYFVKLFSQIWNDSMPQEVSDRLFWAPPAGVSRLMVSGFLNSLVDEDGSFFDALDKSGFRSERKGDFMNRLISPVLPSLAQELRCE